MTASGAQPGLPGGIRRRAALPRIFALVAGTLMIAVAALSDLTGLSVGGGIGRGQIILALFGVLLIAAAVSGDKFPALYKALARIILGLLVAIAFAELAASLIPGILRGRPAEGVNAPGGLPATGQTIGCRYAPFVVWNARSADSGREPEAPDSADSFEVLVLGGTEAWGLTSPDTLRLGALLRDGISSIVERPVRVRDLGQPYFNSTQAVLSLMMDLRSGDRPDLVLLLVGSDEIMSGLETGQPGVHRGLAGIEGRMNAPRVEGEGRTMLDLLGAVLEQSSVFRLVGSGPGMSSGRPADGETPPFPPVSEPSEDYAVPDTLARGLADRLSGTCSLVEALSQAYGFSFRVFLLPACSSAVETGVDRISMPAPCFFSLQEGLRSEIRTRASTFPGMRVLEPPIADTGWVVAGRSVVYRPDANREVAGDIVDVLRERPELLER